MAKSSFYNTNPSTNDLILGAGAIASALDAKVAAEAAVVQAQLHAVSAASSLDLIYLSANTAIDAATTASDSAAASAALASLKADEAAASAVDAAADVSLIAGYSSSAASSAANALTHANNAETSKTSAYAAAFAANASAEAAAISAAEAATFDLDDFYLKTETDTLLAAKANLSGAAFTGAVTISGGQTPWTDTTLPTTSFGRSLANAADAKAARTLVAGTRNYAGAMAATNGMTAGSTESGLFYNMDLSSGVQTFNLPATSGLADGFSIVVRAQGIASGYLTAYVAAEVGKTITYRGASTRFFYLIGGNEVFRFTWLAGGLNIWIAECLASPGPISVNRTHSYAGYVNGPTSWTQVPFDTNSGNTAQFSLPGGGPTYVPVSGVYFHSYRSFFYTSDSNVNTAYLMAANSSNGMDSYLDYAIEVIPGGTAQTLVVTWTSYLNAGEQSGAYMLSATVQLYVYYGNLAGHVRLVSR